MQSKLRYAPAMTAAVFFTLFNLIAPNAAHAQSADSAAKEYSPVVGQEGKDVIWVPTPQALVEKMLDMAKLTAKDVHYDLGSGDGRTVIAAAKRGAQAVGVEYNPDMVALSERAAAKQGVSDKARFIHGDIFQTDFSQATVLTLYLLPNLNVKLRPTILNMKPGTRVVSHAFTMGDWQPDRIESVEGRTAYLWIVPAKVGGTWRWGGAQNNEVVLQQHFQHVEGLAKVNGTLAQFRNAKLDGDRIIFSVIEFANAGTARRDYTGRVNGDVIEGVVKRSQGGEEKWTARRAAN
jgi:SAM-dependent methyltransferase